MENDQPQILLLDDDFGEEDYSVRIMLEQIGEILRMKVICFTDADTFFKHLESLTDTTAIRAILLDHNLNDSEVTGLEVYQELKTIFPELAAKVWGISGEWREAQKYLSQWIDPLNNLNDDAYMTKWMGQLAHLDDEISYVR